MYRHLVKHGHPSNITDLTDLPESCNKIFHQLSKLSIETLNNDKFAFTLDEVTGDCPDILTIPGAINGFGLLRTI